MTRHHALEVRAHARRDGDRVALALTVDLPDGVHIEPHEPADPYLIPTVVTVDGLDDVEVAYPEPTVKDLGWAGATLTVLQGRIVFEVTGRFGDLDRISGTLRYQPCIGGACLPPRTIAWEAPTVGATAYSVLHALAA